MNTYKIGNRIRSCIIRSCAPGPLGSEYMEYANQPYTILEDIEGHLTFAANNKNINSHQRLRLGSSTSFVEELRLSNISITTKILNLIFPKIEGVLVQTSKVLHSDDEGKIFLPNNLEEVYEVFIYQDQELKHYFAAAGTMIDGLDANAPYLICYSFKQNASSLDGTANYYVTMDLELDNNINDTLYTTHIHLDKCLITVDDRIDFNHNANTTIDLSVQIIQDRDTNNYICFY